LVFQHVVHILYTRLYFGRHISVPWWTVEWILVPYWLNLCTWL
jgi:hypothetical protein